VEIFLKTTKINNKKSNHRQVNNNSV